MLLYSPNNPALGPGNAIAFPTQPGYDVNSFAPGASFPFRAYTSTAQSLDAIADTGTGIATLQCMTDGWVFPRMQ